MTAPRKVEIGTDDCTRVLCTDEPGAGGACHEYKVVSMDDPVDKESVFARVSFQNGPVNEKGINGCHQEDLLAIVIDRLQHFQKGDYSCRENAIALTHIETGLLWLRKRTMDRQDRGVEGTSAQ